ncbi:hypothetical protein [Parasitella parasitica]|uniref:Uncharacterized protein n=1 Tax=Parasitella parasitica TaxID=35722 RepID=A0A0B7N0X8_9FUNG|nr:hypothetical protein [Parasitella parasitica]
MIAHLTPIVRVSITTLIYLISLVDNILGPGSEKRVRKCTLLRVLHVRGVDRRQRIRRKKAIIREVNRVVDWVSEVNIKTQSFVNFYVLYVISNHVLDESNPPLLPAVFTDECIYEMMQLVLGLPITNVGMSMPVDRAATLFDDPADCSAGYIPSYSSCLSHMAKTMAIFNLNMIVETFEERAKSFLAFRLRQELPHTHILTYTNLLGPTLINLEILKANPEVYARHLWQFLNEMKRSGAQPIEDEVVTKCDIRWFKETLAEYPMFIASTRRKRQLMLKSMLNIINFDSSSDFTIRFSIDPTFTAELTSVIRNTRARLKRSRILLRGGSILNPRDCFQSRTASSSLITKSFYTAELLYLK